MATVSTLVELFGVSKHTVRTWAYRFRHHLSPNANPPRGDKRWFSDQDLGVFALIAHKRGRNASYEEIGRALQDGERVELPALTQSLVSAGKIGLTPPPTMSADFAPVEVFHLFAEKLTQQYQLQINDLQKEILRLERDQSYTRQQFEKLLGQYNQERGQWVETEKKVSRLETELATTVQLTQQLKEERTARMNAVNQLAAAQAKAAQLEVVVESLQQDKAKASGGLFSRK